MALHYFIRSLTDKLDPATGRSEIERALREWTRYANFTLSPGAAAGAERTMDILFARGAHGDGYPFDGPGGTLAHTFYPAPPNPNRSPAICTWMATNRGAPAPTWISIRWPCMRPGTRWGWVTPTGPGR